MTRKTPYVNMNLTEAARDELRGITLELTTPSNRRLSMSEVIIAALNVARRHREEVLNELGGAEAGE
ncbi:hypothetical protein ABT282_07625 [Streptomyces sp. NPDC000927]|uniref:hypothetical protein n=1 Tax=Streptomyces sp. NPDC000927 TaxID=3154371 RepID=UPI00331C445D